MMDDINTDQIIPSDYVRRLNSDLGQGLFAYMRRSPDGASNADFVLEKPGFRSSAILVVGRNFGCGSSREHAAWAMVAFGIRCVIGVSHAEYFRENCLKNGVLAVALEPAVVEDIAALGGGGRWRRGVHRRSGAANDRTAGPWPQLELRDRAVREGGVAGRARRDRPDVEVLGRDRGVGGAREKGASLPARAVLLSGAAYVGRDRRAGNDASAAARCLKAPRHS